MKYGRRTLFILTISSHLDKHYWSLYLHFYIVMLLCNNTTIYKYDNLHVYVETNTPYIYSILVCRRRPQRFLIKVPCLFRGK